MRPITDVLPKALIQVAGIPLIERIIQNLRQCEVERIVVGVGWLGEHIREYLSTLSDGDLVRVVDVESFEYGPLQTLMTAATELDQNDDFLIMPSDCVVDKRVIETTISDHLYGSTPRVMTIGVDESAQKGATIHADETDLVTGMNLSDTASIVGRCTMTLIASAAFLSYCEIAKKAGETKVSSSINRMIAYNEPVRYTQVEGTWFDIDQPSDLLTVNSYLLKEQTRHSAGIVFVPDGDTIEIGDRMTLAADIMVDPGVTLIGPLLISESSRIASGCIIGPYVSISSESSIGEECSIKNSILLNSAEVPAHRTLEGVIMSGREIIRG